MPLPHIVVAGRGLRLRALAIDLVVAGAFYHTVRLVLGVIRGQPYPDPAPITPFLVAYLMYVVLSIFMPDRNSLGERLASIAPIVSNGNRIDVIRWIFRLIVISFPWASWILLDTSLGRADLSLILVSAGVCGAAFIWGVADVLLMCLASTRRTLTDRVFGILVVLLPPLQPHRAPAGPMYSASDAELGVIAQPPERG
jgi:RDD family